MNSVYHSVISEFIIGFIDEKRALGHKYEKGVKLLKSLDNFITSNYPNEVQLTEKIIVEWCAKKSYEQTSTQLGRISIARGLAKYMTRIGNDTYIYPQMHHNIDRYSYKPYIFSTEQLRSIFKVCDSFEVSAISPYRHILLPIIFRTLYGCGMRVSEVLKLRISDINSENKTIKIYDTKFNKERVIPIADSLLNRYLGWIAIMPKTNDTDAYLFPSPYGGHYVSSSIYKIYRKILWKAGISHSGQGPMLHSFRHTYAVHILKKWVLEKKDINSLLPYLSVYLGHEDIRGTQHYLRLTADLYPDLISKIEDNCSYIIPEVCDETF